VYEYGDPEFTKDRRKRIKIELFYYF
jgi:hypothetical protein